MTDDKKTPFLLEMERRANDILRVFNPTDKDYVVEWDRKNGTKLFRVPAKSEASLLRYIAEKYIHEMFSRITTEKIDQSVINENKRRIDKGFPVMTRWQEQLQFEGSISNVTPDDARKIIAVLYVGLDQEYGIDRLPTAQPIIPDDRPVFSSVLEDIQKERESSPVPPRLQVQPTVAKPPDPNVFSCDYPGCAFKTSVKVALFSHKQTHRDSVEEKKQEAIAQVAQ